MTPTVGRVVQYWPALTNYVDHGPQAAIVTAVHGDTIDLCAFPPGSYPIPHCEIRERNEALERPSWSWPVILHAKPGETKAATVAVQAGETLTTEIGADGVKVRGPHG